MLITSCHEGSELLKTFPRPPQQARCTERALFVSETGEITGRKGKGQTKMAGKQRGRRVFDVVG